MAPHGIARTISAERQDTIFVSYNGGLGLGVPMWHNVSTLKVAAEDKSGVARSVVGRVRVELLMR